MRVAIYGAGGHGKVVWDVLTAAGFEPVGFIDDRSAGQTLLGLPIQAVHEELPPFEGALIAIGNNRVRQEKFELMRQAGFEMVTAIHPSAIVSSHAKLGVGVLVVAGVIVNIDARIGNNVILNTGASVDHDCQISDHVHIAPGSHLGGSVHVEEGAFLGLGTRAIPGVRVGEWAVCGAGSVLVRDVGANTTVVGVPAKPLAPRSP